MVGSVGVVGAGSVGVADSVVVVAGSVAVADSVGSVVCVAGGSVTADRVVALPAAPRVDASDLKQRQTIRSNNKVKQQGQTHKAK